MESSSIILILQGKLAAADAMAQACLSMIQGAQLDPASPLSCACFRYLEGTTKPVAAATLDRQMPDEKARRYLFVAIDRAMRWVYIEIYADQTESSSVDFLAKVKAACPIKICKLLTDNGSQFTDRFTSKSKKKEPSGEHVFDRLCKQFGIEHRLIPPRHPQTNGMVERFNGRISDIVNQTTVWLRRRAGINTAKLRQDLQPQHPTAGAKASDANSSAQGLARKAA